MSDFTENNEHSLTNASMNNIDKITMELLINKSQYKKYVQKTDPSKYSENQVYLGKLRKYSHKIEHLFISLLNNPEKQITNDINEDFTHFVKTCIKYFELKEMEYNSEDHNGDAADEDTVMFGAIDYSMSGSPKSSHKRTDLHKYTMDGYVKLKKH